MTKLSTVHARVRSAVGKGNSLDTQIVDAVRSAARWAERNHTFQYMRRYAEDEFNLEAQYPYIIPVPNRDFKSIDLVKIRDTTGQLFTVGRRNVAAETEFLEGFPTGYDLDGVAQMVFDRTPVETYQVQIWYSEFTSWPTGDNDTNWLIRNGEDFLVYQALHTLAPHLRDPRMRELNAQARDEALRTLILADEDLQYANAPSAMEFVPEGGI